MWRRLSNRNAAFFYFALLRDLPIACPDVFVGWPVLVPAAVLPRARLFQGIELKLKLEYPAIVIISVRD